MSLEDRLQGESDYVLDEFHLRSDLAITMGTSATSTTALGEKYPEFVVEDVQIDRARCTFPIPSSVFHERNGTTVVPQMLALFLPHPPIIAGVDVVSSEDMPGVDDGNTHVTVHIIEDDVHAMGQLCNFIDNPAPQAIAPPKEVTSTVKQSNFEDSVKSDTNTLYPAKEVAFPTLTPKQKVDDALLDKHITTATTTTVAATKSASTNADATELINVVDDIMNTVLAPATVAAFQARSLYILWDIENCSLARTDDAVQVLHNIEAIVSAVAGYGWSLYNRDVSVSRSVFVNRGNANTFHVTPAQIKDLEDCQCTMVSYPSKGSADLSIMQEVDRILRRHRSDSMPPIICMITGDRDFSGTLVKLRSEGYNDAILLHKDVARASLIQHAAHTMKWSIVRTLHSLPNRLEQLPIPTHFRALVEQQLRHAPSFAVTQLSTMRFGDPSLAPDAYGYQSMIDVLSRLDDLGWVVRDDDGELKFWKVVQSRLVIRRYAHARFLLTHVVPNLVPHNAGVADGIQVRAADDVDIRHETTNSESGTVHQLVVRSPSTQAAEAACDALRQRLTVLQRNSCETTIPGWIKHYGDAFISSKVLSDHERESGVVFVIHYKGEDGSGHVSQQNSNPNTAVTVEIASDSPSKAEHAIQSLRSLIPECHSLELSEAVSASCPTIIGFGLTDVVVMTCRKSNR